MKKVSNLPFMTQAIDRSRSMQEQVCEIRKAIRIPIRTGKAVFHTFNGLCDGKEHLAIGFGAWQKEATPLVRLHSECLTGDLFGSHRCDCGEQLDEAVTLMSEGSGILLYLRQEGRDIGLYNKIDAYALQDLGYDTYEANRALSLPADGRSYQAAAQMLQALGITSVRLLSNNPDKATQLSLYGITVTDIVPTKTYLNEINAIYLKAKVQKANHRLCLDSI